ATRRATKRTCWRNPAIGIDHSHWVADLREAAGARCPGDKDRMSDKGGSDLDVFKSLRKSHPQHHQTLVGVAAAPPPGVPDPNHAPPPPPSLRAAPAPGEGNEFSIEADMKEVQPLDDIEEDDAIGEGESGFPDDETTNVFSLPAQPTRTAYAPDENPYQYSEPAWSPAAPITAPKDYAAPKDYIAPAYPASPSLPAPP